MRRRTTGRQSRLPGYIAAPISALSVLVVVGILSGSLYLLSSASRAAAPIFLRPQAGSIPWNERDPLTVMLLGVRGPSPSRAPSDSIIVAQYRPGDRRLTTLSLPPNLWLNVPGYGPMPLNQAYSLGGARLALLTVESALRLPIPYYAVAGTDAFGTLVNALGGVSLPTSGGTAPAAGITRASGTDALRYATSELGSVPAEVRTMHRQYGMFSAFLHTLLSPSNLVRLPGLVDTLGGSMVTNVPYNHLAALATDLSTLPRGRVQAAVILPTGSLVTPYSAAGTPVLLPNWARVVSLAHRLFHRPTIPGSDGIRILNGTTTAGEATNLGTWVSGAGIPVRSVGTAGNTNQAVTRVYVRPNASPVAVRVAHDVAALLQAPLVQGTVGATAVTVVLGSDYQDIEQR